MPTWLVFGIVLSVLVLVHEFGHFIAARIFGIKVEEFALGLPFTKPIFKIKRGETEYAIYPLLFGGFVRLHGEESRVKDSKRSFWERGRKQRMLVIGAGVMMNVVLALVGFSIVYGFTGVPSGKLEKVTIIRVEPGSPAETAGVLVGDRVVGVEGRQISTPGEFSGLMKSWAGLSVNIEVERGKTEILFEGLLETVKNKEVMKITPRVKPPEGQGPIGVAIESYPYLVTEKCVGFDVRCSTRILGAGIKSTGVWMGRVVEGLRAIGKSLVRGEKPVGLSGPVGVYRMTNEVCKQGWLACGQFLSVLSLNLAVFNILPIPALDGGRMLFIWIEWVRRKRMSEKLEQRINQWGMALLIALIILITLQDLLVKTV